METTKMLLLEAIAHEEGFTVQGSRPSRNFNPGDLIYGPESVAFGAVSSDGHFAIFPDIATGWNALRRWLMVPARLVNHEIPGYFFDPNGTTLVGGYQGATLAQVIYRFAPPGDNNDSAGYLAYVSEQTGIPTTAKVTEDMLSVPTS
jgi:hypothetical protein